jgi:hypothetical protein
VPQAQNINRRALNLVPDFVGPDEEAANLARLELVDLLPEMRV